MARRGANILLHHLEVEETLSEDSNHQVLLVTRPNRQLPIKRARMEGFLVLDHLARLDRLPAELLAWVREGRLNFREDRVEGLETAASALLRLLSGQNRGQNRSQNRGKMIVQVAADPSLSQQ